MSDSHAHDDHGHGHGHTFDKEAAQSAYSSIWFWGAVLAVLTIVEFVVADQTSSLAIMMILALLKAVIVLNYFMHIYRLWRDDDHGHEGGHH